MKSFFLLLEDLIWNTRCSYGLWIHGPYGLSRVVEKIPYRHLVKYLRKYGATVGEGGLIERGILIHRPFGKNKPFENLIIGNHVYIGHETIFDLTRKITLKDAASIGSRVQIWTHSGYYQGETVETRNYKEDYGEVTIDEGVLVYSGTLIKHGIHIGAFASVTACSMVNRDVEAFAIASGVPIKVMLRNKIKD